MSTEILQMFINNFDSRSNDWKRKTSREHNIAFILSHRKFYFETPKILNSNVLSKAKFYNSSKPEIQRK